jgi:hypothetical protein
LTQVNAAAADGTDRRQANPPQSDA